MTQEIKNNDWTIVKHREPKSGRQKRQTARRSERLASFNELGDESEEELIYDRLQYRASRHVNAIIDYRFDFHKSPTLFKNLNLTSIT